LHTPQLCCDWVLDYWDNNGTLTNSGTGLFNVTVENTNGTVLLEINGTNIIATNYSENKYNASYEFIQAGVYEYKWHSWGNGTNENHNFSETRYYTVNYLCIPNLVNTSWSSWENLTCSSTQMNQSRFLTEYDENNCETVENVTYYDYQLVGPEYQNTSWSEWDEGICLGENLNKTRNLTQYDIYGCASNTTYFEYNVSYADLTFTDWSEWSNLTCVEDNMNQSQNRTQYDSNNLGCFVNLTEYSYNLTGPLWQSTSWSEWINISCLSDDTMNQSRNSLSYDLYDCAENSTIFEYRATEECDFCIPSSTNSSWTDWQNQGDCGINDLQLQNKSKTEYDENFCYEQTGLESDYFENITYWEFQNVSCNYCSYSIVNTSWSEWTNISCLPDNTMNQSRFKTEYDENYEVCYLVTELESDLWNNGENNTYYEYRNIEFCEYDIPVLINLISPPANYKVDSDDSVNVTFNCSVITIEELSNISLFITDYENENFELNQTTEFTGTLNNSEWEIELNPGNYTWNCFAEDVFGNNSFSELNRTIFIGFVDSDGDGIRDSEDNLHGDESYVNFSGVSNLTIIIGNETNLTTFDDEQDIIFYDSSQKILNFTHNFSKSTLNLSEVKIIKSEDYILVDLSEQLQEDYNKTIYLENNNFVSLCVLDFEINSIEEMSEDCDGANETDFTSCLGNYTGILENNILCIEEDLIIEVSNLKYSAIRGIPLTPSSIDTPLGDSSKSSGRDSSSGGGGIFSPVKCIPEWNCTRWSFCDKDFMQTRKCFDINECNNETGRPIEKRECPDMLFDVLITLKKRNIFFGRDIEFYVDLKEVYHKEIVDIEVVYRIIRNDQIFYEEKETIAIEEALYYLKKIENPNLPSGEYVLQVVVNYGKNQTAASSYPFRILNRNTFLFYLVVIILFGVLGFIAYNWYVLRKEQEEIKKYLLGFKSFAKEKVLQKSSILPEKNVEKKRIYPPIPPVLRIKRKKAIKISITEKNVLTILEGVKRDDGINLIKKYLNYSDFQINVAIISLTKKKLLKKIFVLERENEVKWYFHTKNVKDSMINDKLRFEKNMGWDFEEVLENEKDDSDEFKKKMGWDFKMVLREEKGREVFSKERNKN
jgi:hypothetical protein